MLRLHGLKLKFGSNLTRQQIEFDLTHWTSGECVHCHIDILGDLIFNTDHSKTYYFILFLIRAFYISCKISPRTDINWTHKLSHKKHETKNFNREAKKHKTSSVLNVSPTDTWYNTKVPIINCTGTTAHLMLRWETGNEGMIFGSKNCNQRIVYWLAFV